MKRKRFKEEQIIGILKEWEAGLEIGEVSRKYGVSTNSLNGCYFNFRQEAFGVPFA